MKKVASKSQSEPSTPALRQAAKAAEAHVAVAKQQSQEAKLKFKRAKQALKKAKKAAKKARKDLKAVLKQAPKIPARKAAAAKPNRQPARKGRVVRRREVRAIRVGPHL